MYRDYKILHSSKLPELVEEVNEKLSEGYIPVGGVSHSDCAFYQTVVKLDSQSRSKKNAK